MRMLERSAHGPNHDSRERAARVTRISKMPMPTLSVIIPNFNHARYLRQTLSAILRQSLRPLEVLVIDDASTDESAQIICDIQKSDPLVRLLRNERNIGVNPSINRGLREASGEFVYCGAADDQVLPGFFEKAMSLLGRHPEAKLCVVDLINFDPFTGRTRCVRPRLAPEASFLPADALAQRMSRRRFYAYGGMSIMKRQAILDMGGFPAEMKWYADQFCVHVLAFGFGACYVPEPLVAARVLSSSYANAGRKSNQQHATLQAYVEALRSERFQGAAARIRSSDALCVLGAHLFFALVRRRRYWDFVSARLLCRLLVNVLVTILGFNPVTPSPIGWLDRFVRDRTRLGESIQKYGIPTEERQTVAPGMRRL